MTKEKYIDHIITKKERYNIKETQRKTEYSPVRPVGPVRRNACYRPTVMADDTTSAGRHRCYRCDKTFTTKQHRKRHMENTHALHKLNDDVWKDENPRTHRDRMDSCAASQ